MSCPFMFMVHRSFFLFSCVVVKRTYAYMCYDCPFFSFFSLPTRPFSRSLALFFFLWSRIVPPHLLSSLTCPLWMHHYCTRVINSWSVTADRDVTLANAVLSVILFFNAPWCVTQQRQRCQHGIQPRMYMHMLTREAHRLVNQSWAWWREHSVSCCYDNYYTKGK